MMWLAWVEFLNCEYPQCLEFKALPRGAHSLLSSFDCFHRTSQFITLLLSEKQFRVGSVAFKK